VASSPEELVDGDVRWPLVARIGVALAVLTVVGGLIAAVVAAFVVDRDDGRDREEGIGVVEVWRDPAVPGAIGRCAGACG
jgi:uncharacterized membrane protein